MMYNVIITYCNESFITIGIKYIRVLDMRFFLTIPE